MKYFIDFEFIEGFHKPIWGKCRHFIDLISLGIVCEDGRSYYAISKEFNYKDADQWVKDNVILPIYKSVVSGDCRNHYKVENFHKHFGLSNNQIAADILKFINEVIVYAPELGHNGIEFYGYYSDYDWVLFCSLFGRMIDLPKGFPMYCIDLKQEMDRRAKGMGNLTITKYIVGECNWEITRSFPDDVMDISNFSLDKKLQLLKAQKDYPKQTNEHNALADAKWNYELYKFLQQL